ncbi:MAG: hypothetical protein B6I28_03600 [Fusobacteriia bacterium 4572_132]|nr:MAG: hypothetical protein B6I28_03600 [Fusobacteriia bacterium 4572_132]
MNSKFKRIALHSHAKKEMKKMKKNIVLTGYMGTGKTTIGNNLAKEMGMKFIDTDELIEKKAGIKISEIFKNFGEEKFREIETEVAKEMLKINNSIISTGGGIVLKDKNMEYLRKNGIVFLLWASPETIYNRIKNNKNRPLLRVKNPQKKIEEMLEEREVKYKESNDFEIITDQKSIYGIILEIKKKYLDNY